MKIFARRIIINRPANLSAKGPLLIACNHPNSFLDAIILDILFERSIWSLARGDVFKSPLIIKLLTSLKILPVYRVSEGSEHLSNNYHTFDQCKELFRQGKIVLIFSEGRCINEWHLRKLRKGTARLAISAWNADIPLKVLPIGINYSSFRRFGKNIIINFGDVITQESINALQPDGLKLQSFKKLLDEQLHELVYEIDKNDKVKQRELLERRPGRFRKMILAIPAALGWILHAPLYLPIKRFTLKRTDHNDHYDSVLLALLLVTYPLYLGLITIVAYALLKSSLCFLILIIFPFTAWSYVQLKEQLDR